MQDGLVFTKLFHLVPHHLHFLQGLEFNGKIDLEIISIENSKKYQNSFSLALTVLDPSL